MAWAVRLLLAGWGGRLAWVVLGLIGGMVGAVVNAWIIMVEILR